ncbi:MAG: tetratricopeptide repeat protein [Flavobacteriales bacterium]|nr:tetratricopeptide repeat protein [Flavobacteriales bacterium]MBP6697532.1 tetratricopeptide repeat protein [Flavobacteriales bacterium]
MRAFVFVVVWSLWSMGPAQAQGSKGAAQVRSALDRGKALVALRKCGTFLARGGDRAVFIPLRAEAYNKLGEYAAARSDAAEALALDPGNAATVMQSGIAFLGMNQADSAIVRFHSLPAGPERDLRLAMAYGMAHRCTEALPLLTMLITKAPAPNTLRERGACYAQLGDSANARMDLDQAIALAPRDPVNWNSRGFHRWAAFGDHKRAIADYDQAIKFNPNYSFALNNRGYSWLQLDELRKAERDIELAGRKNNSNPYVQRNLGMLASKKGATKEACAHFREAMAMGGTPLYGNELSELLKDCPTVPVPQDLPKDGPGLPRPQRNAPGGSNAP